MAVEGRDIYIQRKGRRMGQEINLLMVSEDGINHYTAIKSLSRLLKSSNTKHKCKQHFCMNCLQGFTQESSRDQHQVYCKDNESVRVEMPKQGSTIEFKDGQNQFRVPFIMYTDFELILELMDLVEPGSPSQPYTNEVNQHTPSGWCVYSKFAYGDVDDLLRLYRDKDCIETFCNYIKEEAHRLYHMFPESPMGPLTKKQWKKYKRSTKCHICYKPFTLRDPKVRDYCHYTGLYKVPAHSLCNLRYKIPSYIPVVFHNLSGYNTHLFIRELGAHVSDMEVITKNKEDYIFFPFFFSHNAYLVQFITVNTTFTVVYSMPMQKESGRHLLVPQNVPQWKPTLAKPKALQIVITYSKIVSQSRVMMILLSGYCVGIESPA